MTRPQPFFKAEHRYYFYICEVLEKDLYSMLKYMRPAGTPRVGVIEMQWLCS